MVIYLSPNPSPKREGLKALIINQLRAQENKQSRSGLFKTLDVAPVTKKLPHPIKEGAVKLSPDHT
jgi:hypothetical protein